MRWKKTSRASAGTEWVIHPTQAKRWLEWATLLNFVSLAVEFAQCRLRCARQHDTFGLARDRHGDVCFRLGNWVSGLA